MNTFRRICFLAAICSSLFAGAQAQQVPQQRVRGDLVALEGAKLQLRITSGQVLDYTLADNARISLESQVELKALSPGAYVGTTSAPQADGTLRAVQIRIFPEALRGTGEGHRLMEAQGNNTMTNATVSSLSASAPANTMTNATVSDLGAGLMTLKYKDGEKQIIIPADVPVIQTEIADRSVLVNGAHLVLSLSRSTDGNPLVERVTVGKNGSTPM